MLPSRGWRSPFRFALLLAALLVGGALSGPPSAGKAGWGSPAAPPAAPHTTVVDTIAVFGPALFESSSGRPQYHVERFTMGIVAGAVYALRLENGAPDGSRRASSAAVVFNGAEIINAADVDGTVVAVERAIVPEPSNTLEVTVAGEPGAEVRLTIFTLPFSEFTIFGPERFTRSGAPATVTRRFSARATAGAPFRLYVENRGSDAAGPVTDGFLRLNSALVIGPSGFGLEPRAIVRPVDLSRDNVLEAQVTAGEGSSMTVRITATDVTPPIVAIRTPLPGSVVHARQVEVAGLVTDETPTQLTVAGQRASVATGGAFAVMVPLPVEGPNVLEVEATDAAGHRVTDTLTVDRDTEGPRLEIAEPREGSVTTQSEVAVAGKATGKPPIQVRVNGRPLTSDPDGAFRGQAALEPGPNRLTFTAADATGRTVAETRTVHRVRMPGLLVEIPTAGLRVHLVADSLAASHADGAGVSTWSNLGTVGDALQVDGAKLPTYHAGQAGNSFNSHAHVGFNEGADNDEYLEITNIADHTSSTLILVFKQDDAATHIYGPFSWWANSNDRGLFATRRWCCASPPMSYWDRTNSWKHANFQAAAGVPYVAVWRLDGVSKNISFQVNGTVKSAYGITYAMHTPIGRYLVGSTQPGAASSSERFDGQIAELLFYDRPLTDLERDNAVSFLGAKYGISVGLPSDQPAAPTNLTATAVDFQRIDLSWTDNSTEEAGYRIERRVGQTGAFVSAATTAANATSHTDAGVPSGTELCYRVVGFNAVGDGPPSNVACATTPAAPPLADSFPPSGLRAHLVADNLASALADGAAVGAWPNHGSEADALQWTGSKRATFHAGAPGNLFGGHAHVGLNEGSDNDEWMEIGGVTGHGSATLIAVFALQSSGDTIHDEMMLGFRDSTTDRAGFWTANKFSGPFPYQIAWWDASNGWKDSNFVAGGSVPYIAVWRVAGGATVDFQVDGTAQGSRALANPTPLPFDRYRLAQSNQGQASRFDGQVAELILYDRALSDAERDAIVYELGQKYAIDVAVGPPPGPPAAPSGLTATAVNDGRIDLAWTDNASDETGFKVQRRLGQAGQFTEIAQSAPNATAHSDVTVAAETEYCYQVLAFNGQGSSSPSNIACATTPADLPPDPETVAPPIDPTEVTTMKDALEFLYTGPDPIQTGVAPGTIDLRRAAAVRGRVLKRDGTPLPGVTVSILDHPELGQTLSRSDGEYDLALNGGGLLNLVYERSGYTPAHRPVDAAWQSWGVVEDVVLLQRDTLSTVIDFSEPTEVARGTPQTDADGTRQATLLFPQTAQATMLMPDSTSQPLPTLTVRATEYTVGESGDAAMPAPLPATSAYTYAVELSVDEAEAAGALGVEFGQPVPLYIENFLGFPVGLDVPVGRYDMAKAAWLAEPDGRVLEIVSIAGGIAAIDANGDGLADSDVDLAALGLTQSERQRLATLYSANTELWRMPLLHFSPIDGNYPLLGNRTGSDQPPKDSDPDKDPCEGQGSIIECQSQILGERIGVPGTPFTLNYRSERVPGSLWGYTVTIPLTGDTLPTELQRVTLEVEIAGRVFADTFPALPDQETTFTWDGKDAYGRTVQGPQAARVRVGYVYPQYYAVPAGQARSFGLMCQEGSAAGGRAACIIPATVSSLVRQEATVAREWTLNIGAAQSLNLAIGAWSLDIHHIYDPVNQVLYLGDGSRRDARAELSAAITAVAGTGDNDLYTGDSLPALETPLVEPYGIALAPDGTFYIADWWNCLIRKVDLQGIMTNIAGTPETCGFSGDGGPASQALLDGLWDIDLAPDGSLYFMDFPRIRRISPDGIITTVAGTGTAAFSPDGAVATAGPINPNAWIALGQDGSLYFTEDHRVRRVGPEGILSTVAGTGVAGFAGDRGPALSAQLQWPSGLAVGPDGSLYIADTENHRVRRVAPEGTITTVAGSGAGTFSGDGGPATQAGFDEPLNVAVGPDGSLYISDWFDFRARRVGPDGIITTVAGTGFAYSDDLTQGDGGPATAAELAYEDDLELGPDGSLYIADVINQRIRRVRPNLPGLSGSELLIAGEDGSELYVFDSGRHLRTLDALTQSIRYSFGYTPSGRLTQVTDAEGNVTMIERDASGRPTAILAPFGQRTALVADSTGYLTRITNPGNETIALSYHPGGLLATLTDPRSNTHSYTYDATGRFIRDDNPAGGLVTLARTEEEDAYEVVKTTGLGRSTTYRVEDLTTGGQRRVNTSPSGLVSETTIGTNGTSTSLSPDGTVTTVTVRGDARYRMESPVLEQRTVAMPSGLTSTIRGTRRVTFSILGDPLSWTTQLDSLTVNTRVFTNLYDVGQRTFTSVTPVGRRFTARLDSLGRLTKDSIPSLAAVRYTYDASGRLSQLSQGSRNWTYGYDTLGRLAHATDPLGRADSFFYDTADRLTRQVLPDAQEILYGYDANGNLTSLTPPARPAHGFTYTAIDQASSYTPPDLGPGAEATTYAYNLDKQLMRITRPDSLTIDFGYDAGGRASTVTTPSGQLTYGYHTVTGNLTSVIASDPLTSGLSFSYNGSLLTGVTWSGTVAGSIGATYNNDFRVTSTSVNGANTIMFGYDADGLLTQGGALAVSRNTANGLITGTTLGTLTTTLAYNGLGEWSEFAARYGASDLLLASYVRDSLGRITQLTDRVQGDTTVYGYRYDPAGRLVEVRTDGVVTATYDYDANGNRTQFTGAGGTVTGIYDAQDRLLSYGDASYSYTANGELTRKVVGADTTRFTYDVLGNLKSVTLSEGTLIEYLVDGLNRRIGKKVNGVLVQGFLYENQLEPIAELNGAGQVVSRFVYSTRSHVPDYMVKGGVTYRIVSDHLGSVRLVVNTATGVAAQRIDYDAFGGVTLDTSPGFQPFGYAGGLFDQHVDLIRLGARDYDPGSGRWSVKDPIGFLGRASNLYGYALADPVNLIDPSGLVCLSGKAMDAVAGAAGGAAAGAAGGAATGGPGIVPGAVVGGIVGGVAGLFSPPSLGEAFTIGGIAGATSGGNTTPKGIAGGLLGGGTAAVVGESFPSLHPAVGEAIGGGLGGAVAGGATAGAVGFGAGALGGLIGQLARDLLECNCP